MLCLGVLVINGMVGNLHEIVLCTLKANKNTCLRKY